MHALLWVRPACPWNIVMMRCGQLPALHTAVTRPPACRPPTGARPTDACLPRARLPSPADREIKYKHWLGMHDVMGLAGVELVRLEDMQTMYQQVGAAWCRGGPPGDPCCLVQGVLLGIPAAWCSGSSWGSLLARHCSAADPPLALIIATNAHTVNCRPRGATYLSLFSCRQPGYSSWQRSTSCHSMSPGRWGTGGTPAAG